MSANQRNNAADFLQYAQTIQNPQSMLNNPALTQLRNKYQNADPRNLAYQLAQQKGISPDQLNQIAKQLGITQ